MRWDLARELNAAERHTSIALGSDVWNLYMRGVVRISRDLFIQVAVLGPRVCTVTIRTRDVMVPGVTGQRLLDAIAEWLLSGGSGDHGYIELPEIVEPWS